MVRGGGVTREGLSEEVTSEQTPKGSEEGSRWMSRGGMFQAEGTASAKALSFEQS